MERRYYNFTGSHIRINWVATSRLEVADTAGPGFI